MSLKTLEVCLTITNKNLSLGLYRLAFQSTNYYMPHSIFNLSNINLTIVSAEY